ncbi:MAG: DUF1315 family protein [Kistimonas sp.]|nr:DUF1315 family protein [Kistimonas sp.]
MNLEHIVERLTPEQAAQLRQALELGKWSDGRVLEPQHREQGMRTLLLWEARHLPQERRTGFLPQGCRGKKKTGEPSVQEAVPVRMSQS